MLLFASTHAFTTRWFWKVPYWICCSELRAFSPSGLQLWQEGLSSVGAMFRMEGGGVCTAGGGFSQCNSDLPCLETLHRCKLWTKSCPHWNPCETGCWWGVRVSQGMSFCLLVTLTQLPELFKKGKGSSSTECHNLLILLAADAALVLGCICSYDTVANTLPPPLLFQCWCFNLNHFFFFFFLSGWSSSP